MLRHALLTSTLAIAVTLSGTTAAHAAETRQFRGEGSSDFGLSLIYARADAQR